MKKLHALGCFVVILCMTGSSLATDKYYWSQANIHQPGGLNWEDPNSWIESPSDTIPPAPPNDNIYDPIGGDFFTDFPGINSGVLNINEGILATPYRIVIGANKYANDPTHAYYDPAAIDPLPEGVLNVYSVGDPGDPNDYGLHSSTEILIGHQENGEGVLNIYGNAYGEALRCGQWIGANAVVNIYDGGHFQIGWWGCWLGQDNSNGTRGTGRINLKGTGSMTVNGDETTVPGGLDGIQMFENSHIDIESGLLAVLGDHTAQLQGYVDSGWITAHGGQKADCSVSVTYDSDVNYTYVESTGAGCGCKGFLAGDLDKNCYVNVNDFGAFANDWLGCTEPSDPSCWN